MSSGKSCIVADLVGRNIKYHECNGEATCTDSGCGNACRNIMLDPFAMCREYKAVGQNGIVSTHQEQVIQVTNCGQDMKRAALNQTLLAIATPGVCVTHPNLIELQQGGCPTPPPTPAPTPAPTPPTPQPTPPPPTPVPTPKLDYGECWYAQKMNPVGKWEVCDAAWTGNNGGALGAAPVPMKNGACRQTTTSVTHGSVHTALVPSASAIMSAYAAMGCTSPTLPNQLSKTPQDNYMALFQELTFLRSTGTAKYLWNSTFHQLCEIPGTGCRSCHAVQNWPGQEAVLQDAWQATIEKCTGAALVFPTNPFPTHSFPNTLAGYAINELRTFDKPQCIWKSMHMLCVKSNCTQCNLQSKWLNINPIDNSPWQALTNDNPECPAGTYFDASSCGCTSCPGGKYKPTTAGACKDCPAGKYAVVNAYACKTCGAGRFSSGSAHYCTICAGNSEGGFPLYQNQAEQSACLKCTVSGEDGQAGEAKIGDDQLNTGCCDSSGGCQNEAIPSFCGWGYYCADMHYNDNFFGDRHAVRLKYKDAALCVAMIAVCQGKIDTTGKGSSVFDNVDDGGAAFAQQTAEVLLAPLAALACAPTFDSYKDAGELYWHGDHGVVIPFVVPDPCACC